MNAVIFVAIVCMGQQCSFLSSTQPLTEKQCQANKKEFLALPFKPEVTLAATQCMQFESEKAKI